MKFKIGQTVQWSSQAGGVSTTKTGVIVKVVGAGADAGEILNAYKNKHKNARGGGFGSPRSDVSYLVEVGPTSATGKVTRVYWPLTSHLEATVRQGEIAKHTFTPAKKAARKIKKSKRKD